ncbi:uncharacterized protein LOC131152165 isoform X2 [Malania oleifera]|uniref:uncharacterized protein LOC131152165 isoform X2 n=1 Tax=Malania oleifera TaxID=397392 RepID=UPI0025AE4716|nr:uncharacterized protein LOC131152165 isoform X2 [Malania oleifera]
MAGKDGDSKKLLFYSRMGKKRVSVREKSSNLNLEQSGAGGGDSSKKQGVRRNRVCDSVGDMEIEGEEGGGIQNQVMGTILEENRVLGGCSYAQESERVAAEDDAEGEKRSFDFDFPMLEVAGQGDCERELDDSFKTGSRDYMRMVEMCAPDSSTDEGEEREKRMSLDFYFPVLEVASEGHRERELDDDIKQGSMDYTRVEVISVSSSDTDEGEDWAKQLVMENDVRGDNLNLGRKGLGFSRGQTKLRSTSVEEGKGIADDSLHWEGISSEPVSISIEVEDGDEEDLFSGLQKLAKASEHMVEIFAEEYKRNEAMSLAKFRAQQRRENKARHSEWIKSEVPMFLSYVEERESQESSELEDKMKLEKESEESSEDECPFFSAMRMIKERNVRQGAQRNSVPGAAGTTPLIQWTPSYKWDSNISMPIVPSLRDLCINLLAKNAEAIVSLDSVPDSIKHKLSNLLCDSRRLDAQFMELLVKGSPTQICVKNCSCITEEQLIQTFEHFDTKNLMVLQLDLCGRSMTDHTLCKMLTQCSNSLPVLAAISLRGAFHLSDVGLNALLVSAPALQSINLGMCSLLTHNGIITLSNSFGPILREIYIDDCHNIDAMLILPALKKVKQLEVLSVAGIQTVSDDFIRDLLTVHGPNMKELVLARCRNLTDISLKCIGKFCSRLCVLDLSHLNSLTNLAIKYLANGCRSIENLKLQGSDFSDEAISAFLEASGGSLRVLSLNCIIEVGANTAMSLARNSRNLLSLDLSWCRNLTDDAVGLIVDSCLSLKLLKLFGCTQHFYSFSCQLFVSDVDTHPSVSCTSVRDYRYIFDWSLKPPCADHRVKNDACFRNPRRIRTSGNTTALFSSNFTLMFATSFLMFGLPRHSTIHGSACLPFFFSLNT